MIIAEQEGTRLRFAQEGDLQQVDEITRLCYKPIFESYLEMLGEACYQVVRHDPELTWEQRKTGQVHRLFQEHPEWLWVLESGGTILGFVTFYLFPDQGYGHLDNNGVHPNFAGKGWGKFMYRHVLDYFRQQGLGYAHVDTGLDPAHLPARKAYQSVGFDRQIPNVEYWQDLNQFNPGSVPEG